MMVLYNYNWFNLINDYEEKIEFHIINTNKH